MLVPNWIQAIATCILLVITLFYAYHTKRLVDESYTAFLTVEKLDNPSMEGCILSVINHGPGHAIDVKVYIEMNCFSNIIEGINNTTKIVATTGPSVLISGKKASFEIRDPEYSMPTSTKIYIKYKVQSGKEFNYEWVTDLESDYKVRLVKQHRKLGIVNGRIKSYKWLSSL